MTQILLDCSSDPLVGLLVILDRIALNRHLTAMKICSDLLCSACGEEDGTPYHFSGMLARNSILGKCLMELEKPREV